MRYTTGNDVPVVLSIENTYLWVGKTHNPIRLRPIDESPGAFAAAMCSALRVANLKGHCVICVGAPTHHRRVTVAHAMLALLNASSVRFIDVATAARIAAEAPNAMVVNVGAPILDDSEVKNRSIVRDPNEVPPLTHVYLSGATQVSHRGASQAVLLALSQVTIPERADAAQRIVLCGPKQPGEFLYELRCMAEEIPVYRHLIKLTDNARIVPTPYNPMFVPWFGGIITARARIDVGYVVVADQWLKHGALCLPDEDAIAHVDLTQEGEDN